MKGQCEEEVFYQNEDLKGTSEGNEFEAQYGWFTSSVRTVGDVDLQGGRMTVRC